MSSYNNCTEVTPHCPVEATTYGYYPNLGGNAFFAALFGTCAVSQLVLGIYFSTGTFLVALVVGAVLELVGYITRVKMNNNPWDDDAFQKQITSIILGPVFIAAGIYLALKHIVLSLGPESSRLKPRLFTWVFIGCDIVSLILQAAGGGVAGSAGNANPDLLDVGNTIMLAGIIFQVATMSLCGIFALDFFLRCFRRGSWNTCAKGIKVVVFGVSLAYITVLIRCIYR